MWDNSEIASDFVDVAKTEVCTYVQSNKRLTKKLPKHCEVANILIGQVCIYLSSAYKIGVIKMMAVNNGYFWLIAAINKLTLAH